MCDFIRNHDNLCDVWGKHGDGVSVDEYGKFMHYQRNEVQIRLYSIRYPHEVPQSFPDFFIVVNSIHTFPFISEVQKKEKSVLCQMEPNLVPPPDNTWMAEFNQKTFNLNEWHLSLTLPQFQKMLPLYHGFKCSFEKPHDMVVSTVLSEKYTDPGHIARIDFVRRAQHLIKFDVFGSNAFDWLRYKGSPPLHQKDEALFPYRYHFNVENHSLPGYYTEKLIDGILSECLVFYSGPPNIQELIDPDAYVLLDLNDFEWSIATIKKALEEDWWSQRISKIRKAKKRILEVTGMMPRFHHLFTSKMVKS
jgi:hypothetical protein